MLRVVSVIGIVNEAVDPSWSVDEQRLVSLFGSELVDCWSEGERWMLGLGRVSGVISSISTFIS